LNFVNPFDDFWYRLYAYTSWAGILFAHTDPITLKVIKPNGGSWNYKSLNKNNEEFQDK